MPPPERSFHHANHPSDNGVGFFTLDKGRHHWRFRYPRGQEPMVVAAVAELAHEPDSGLDHFDLALLAYQMGRLSGRRGSQEGPDASNCAHGP